MSMPAAWTDLDWTKATPLDYRYMQSLWAAVAERQHVVRRPDAAAGAFLARRHAGQPLSREEFVDIEAKMEEILSDLEWKVLMSYLDGKSYQEIAVDLDRHVKSIDNALQRVKRKLERYMDNRGDDVDISTVYRGLSSINRRLHDLADAELDK